MNLFEKNICIFAFANIRSDYKRFIMKDCLKVWKSFDFFKKEFKLTLNEK